MLLYFRLNAYFMRFYRKIKYEYFFSGGNDNKLFVWNVSSQSPMQTYTDHLAAVKVLYFILFL